MINDVTFMYPRVNSGYIFNSLTRKSEPCTEDTPGAYWSCNFTLPKPEAIKIWNMAKDHFNAVKASGSPLAIQMNEKKAMFKTIHGYKEREDDTIMFATRKSCRTAKGKKNTIMLKDARAKDLEDLEFWSGSTGNIIFSMKPTFNQTANEWGIRMYLDGVQVVDFKKGELQEGFSAVDNATDNTPANNTGAQFTDTTETVMFGDMETTVETGSNTVANDFDDEIPF